MNKLYTIVRKDLKGHGQRAVQAAHSVAEYLLKNPNTTWDNGTIVLLTIWDEESLVDFGELLTSKGINFEMFREPDLDNQFTALTAESDFRVPFCGLKLL